MDPSIKSSAFLKILPKDLREQTLAQSGLDERFEDIREYALNQVGRRTAQTLHRRHEEKPVPKPENEPVPMDLTGKLTELNECDQAYWTGKSGWQNTGTKGGKPTGKSWNSNGKAGGKGGGKNTECYRCGKHGHYSWECRAPPQG